MNDIRNLWQLFLAGGFLMWPIAAMSVVVVTFGLERLWALRRSRFVPRPLLEALTKPPTDGPFDPRRIYRLCQEHPSVLADVLKTMLEKIGRPLPEVEHAVTAAQDREASKLYANIRPISLAVTITPLLGLLGTVQGMILAFYTTATLEAGANRAAELAQGIYVALITTFAGLCVAIPAAMIAHFDMGDALAHDIRKFGDRLAVEIILPIAAIAPHHIMALVDFGEELGDFFGRILQIRIHGDHHLTAHCIKPRHDGWMLAKIPQKLNHPHVGGMAQIQGFECCL
jgi:biopolymer transport protein ExbB